MEVEANEMCMCTKFGGCDLYLQEFFELILPYTGKFWRRKNGNFNNFAKNIFVDDLYGQHKRCGMATLLRNLISRLSKIHEIRENKAMQKFTGIIMVFFDPHGL